MNNLKLNFCALALLAVTAVPAIADSVELAVKGTIIPAACKPSLAGDGIIDYGYITAGQLDANTYTLLDPKELTFSINCDAPVKIAIKAINAQKQSPAGKDGEGINHAAVAPANVYGVDRPVVVSMGLDGETPIGGYSVIMKSSGFTASNGAESGSVTPVFNDLASESSQWQKSASNYNTLYGTGNVHMLWSWAKTGTLPYALEALTGQLVVQAYINKASVLDLSKAIKLNGMTTIELVYL